MPRHLGIPWILAALALPGCSERPRFDVGDQCELTFECGAPLVCRLGRCREECRDTRDCRTGLVCLRDSESLGACALPDEGCTLSTDCVAPLVCVMRRCVNECVEDVDCAPGSRCEDEGGGVRGCHDTAMTECEYNSDCDAPLICANDRRCREQCRGDRDCRDGTVCDETISQCVLPTELPDAGPIDAGDVDGGEDAGELDASEPDGGAEDAGLDAMAMLDVGPPDGGPVDGGTITTPAPMPALAAGYQHTCATRMGALHCWGSSSNGQIGDGTMIDRPIPVALGSLTAPTLVATGATHTCALATGGVRCWGDNTLGQVGDGTATVTRTSPVAVGVASASWVVAGRDHSCALEGTTARCWGDNTLGQLGDGTTTQRRAPRAVVGLGGTPVELAARARHTCARLDDGTLQCWGENRYGQLGNGSTTGAGVATPTPQDVAGVTDAVEVICGSTHTCARRRDGSVWCWGANTSGQLGDGTHAAHVTAAIVPGLPPAAELAGGLDHVCARGVDGRVHCWGGNTFGQGGLDPLSSPTADEILTPRLVPGTAGATELTAGDFHTCARIGADAVRCWGFNSRGQLGDGTMTDSHAGVMVAFP